MELEQRRGGFLSHWSHGLMVVTVGIWVAAVGFVWWALGVRLDAADASRAEPTWITRWDGPVLVIGLLALLATFLSACVAVRKASGS